MGAIIKRPLGLFDLAIVDVLIENPINKEQVLIQAAVDTGAVPCLLKKSVIETLGLTKTHTGTYDFPKVGEREVYNYVVNIGIFENQKVVAGYNNVEIAVLESKTYCTDAILGTLLLNRAVFVYDGINKRFELSFP